MDKPATDASKKNDNKTPVRRPRPNPWLLVIAVVGLMLLYVFTQLPRYSHIEDYGYFMELVKDRKIQRIEIAEDEAYGIFRDPPPLESPLDKQGKPRADRNRLLPNFHVRLPADEQATRELSERLQEGGAQIVLRPKTDSSLVFTWIVAVILPIALFIFLWLSFRRTRDQLMGGGFLTGFSKSTAKRYEPSQQSVTFADVAGVEGVKRDLQEMVDFLKDPAKFQRLGGRVPKGVLLMGPPGTGKTLLARAVAGEAGVPFFSVNGSEFIQMFVGVGASRVRDLFQNAKENAPAIIFVDEIDAVGRQRGAGLGGGHDEREQTLNQILSEMDGFSQTDSVIVLAATNRPDVLDPALLRPGRFDRHVTVNRPTQKGRHEIFKVHVRDVPLADDVDLELLARSTIGLTGADIRNIVNEAALWAARHNKTAVDRSDFDYARDKVLMGATREEVLSEKEKEKTAYHEAGHTLMAWLLPGAHRVHKVTIIPRGRALGVTQTTPTEDRFNMAESELRDHLTMMLGGREAERLIFQETSVGAENDLERATGLARRMVTHWGMSERLGPVSYKMADDDPFLGRELHQHRQFSEFTMRVIDEEVAQLLHGASQRAHQLLADHRDKLDSLSHQLLAKEELNEQEITTLIGPSVHASESNGKGSVQIAS
ncbi:MAG: ATP-dependent zinc metalloprotease FtsH [Pirellulaceae bacterium]